MFDAIKNTVGGYFENMGDLGARALESVGIVNKDDAYVSIRDGHLRHNLDLDGFSADERREIESMLTPLAEEKSSIEAELAGDVDPTRRAQLGERLKQIQQELTDVKWEIEHQPTNFGKAFFGSILPGGGLLAQGIGFDGEGRLDAAAEVLEKSADDLGVGAGTHAVGDESSSSASPSNVEIDSMVDNILSDPAAVMNWLEGMTPAQRSEALMFIQQKLQHTNQMHTMMSNFQKSIHDTQKGVLNNFRV